MSGASEHATQNAIRNDLAGQVLCFRANVGRAWTGSRVEHLPGGRVMIYDARPFSTGLPPGFSDLFGEARTLITPEMVGGYFGRFFALEVKTDSGKPSPNQSAFLHAVKVNGGLSGVARSVEDARKILGIST